MFEFLVKIDNAIAVNNTQLLENGTRSNIDLDPTPEKDRTWRTYNYVLIWFQSSLNITEWNSGATLIKSSGLIFWKTMIAGIVADIIGGLFVIFNSRAGSSYHIGYPIILRSVFGVYGYYFYVIIRGFVAIIWYSVQTFYGGCVLDVLLRCVFGHKWMDIPNHIPENQAITTRLMAAFVLFWLIQLPIMFIHPKHIRHFFTFKAICLPWATIGLLIYCCVEGHGAGNFDVGVEINRSSSAEGWGFMLTINSILGSIAAMIINQPDVARYAKKPSSCFFPQFFGFFISKVAVLLFSIVATASMYRVTGVAYWNFWDLLNAILDLHWTAGARTGIFFVSAAFVIGTFGTNLFGNAIPFSADISGLFPRYFTIKRGQVFIAILAWAIVPWKLMADAASFLAFLGSYSIFVGPILGCMLADYFFVRRGNLHIPSLYTSDKDGLYYFKYGVNWWASLAFVFAVVLGIPGLNYSVNPTKASKAAGHMSDISWLLTTIAAMIFHTILGKYIFKPSIYPKKHENVPKSFEYMVKANGCFEEDEQYLCKPKLTSDNNSSQCYEVEKKGNFTSEVVSLEHSA